jgi:hypothetical protein
VLGIVTAAAVHLDNPVHLHNTPTATHTEPLGIEWITAACGILITIPTEQSHMTDIAVFALIALGVILGVAHIAFEIVAYRIREKQRRERLKELEAIMAMGGDMRPKITVDVEGAGDLVPGTAGHGGGGAQ